MSEQIYTNKVSIVHFHIFMSFYSIYAILLRIRFCRDLRFFCVNFWGQKLRLRKFFDKYDVCASGQPVALDSILHPDDLQQSLGSLPDVQISPQRNTSIRILSQEQLLDIA